MSEIVTDCSRCRARHTTLNVMSENVIAVQQGWQNVYEVFCVCRNCTKSSILVLVDENYETAKLIRNHGGLVAFNCGINDFVRIRGVVSIKDNDPRPCPEYLPENIESVFKEGTVCLTTQCYNAAGTMFRLCLDLATKELLPSVDENGLTSSIRRSLGLRLGWLFKNNCLPPELEELSSAVKDDGNDGAHSGTLTVEEAEDLFEFSTLLLQRLYTHPRKLQLATERREKRRSSNQT